MSRLHKLFVTNYRSVSDTAVIHFPPDLPVVLIGENNAGKSNIVRALDLLLGHSWPGNHEPEDNEFFDRSRQNMISVAAEFAPDDPLGGFHTGIRWSYDEEQHPPLSYRVSPGSGGYPDAYVSNAIRSTCTCVVIEADRNLNYHLSYASKWTLLSRLMHRFHKAMLEDNDARTELLGLFQQLRERFNRIQPFADFKTILQDRLGEFAQGMSHRLEVDFEAYNPINFFHALRLHAAEGDERRTLQEMGTGEQQILALSFAYAYAATFHEGMFLVVEEPEAHLHPLAQQWLASRLGDMCSSGLQVLLTTHSAHFINMLALPGLVLVRKKDGATVIRQVTAPELRASCVALGAPGERLTDTNILPFYEANATAEILEGFFARAVVLVEGKTESTGLPRLLQRCGFENTQYGVAILPVHGKGNLAKWHRLFATYGIPAYIIFDNDARNDSDGIMRADALAAVGITGSAASAQLALTSWSVGSHHCIFGRDFEGAMRAGFPDYETRETQARESGITSKPFVARWALERMAGPNDGAGWQYARALTNAIRLAAGIGAST